MKRLDRFILVSFIGPFIMILFIVIFVLMMQFLWLYIDELVGKGLSFGVVVEFMGWGACTILPTALPLATLLASLMTLGTMSENNELIAIKSAGVSLTRIITPIMIASAFISVGAFYASNNLVPMAFNQIYTLREDIGKTKNEIKIPTGTFYDGIDGYVLRVGSRNDATGMMYDVMVYDHTSNKGNVFVTLADSATMKMSSAKDYLAFKLYEGCNYQETNQRKQQDTTRQLQRIEFTKQELIIPLESYAFEKSSGAKYGDQVKSRKIELLKKDRDSLRYLEDSAFVKRYAMVAASPRFTLRKQLDTAVASGISRNFPHEDELTWKTTGEKISSYERAKDTANEMAEMLDNYYRDSYERVNTLDRTSVAFWGKYAGALACFILFFVGAPLGALINKKGGLGVSAIIAIMFFVLYWVVDITGQKLGKNGAVSGFAGSFAAGAVLLPIGLFLTWKAINDSPLFNTDSFKSWFRRAKSKIRSMFKKTRIVYMGTPEFAVAPLDALIKAGYNIVGVVTVADKPSGRGLKVNESAVKKYAVEHNIPVLQPVKLKDPEFLEALKAWKADLFVVVAFRMLPEEVWTMPQLGTFNLHAALLPQYRGAAPINWAVINGERHTGVTTFMIDKDIDTGGIILRQDCRIEESENVGDVHDKLMAIGSDLVVQTVQGIIEKNVETRVQRSFIQGSEVLKPAPKLTRELCHIDWNDSTKQIYNLIRGLSPYPTAFTELVKDGGSPQQMKIFAAEKITLESIGKESVEPGVVLSDGKSYLAIGTKDGAISIKDLQLAGKKRMDVKSFLLGFRDPESYKTTLGTSSAEIAKTKPSI